MERKTVKISENIKLYEIQENSIFLWKLEREEPVNDYMVQLTFVRDDEKPYIEKLKNMEKEFHRSSAVPMWLIILLAILAIGFFSAFLTFYFLSGREVDMNFAFPIYILPALVFTAILGVLGLIRTRQVLKYVNDSTNRFETYKEKVDALVKKYESNEPQEETEPQKNEAEKEVDAIVEKVEEMSNDQ